MWRGYTYSENSGMYYCSSKTAIGCTARIKLTKNEGIQIIADKHSHISPRYVKVAGGKYVKVLFYVDKYM